MWIIRWTRREDGLNRFRSRCLEIRARPANRPETKVSPCNLAICFPLSHIEISDAFSWTSSFRLIGGRKSEGCGGGSPSIIEQKACATRSIAVGRRASAKIIVRGVNTQGLRLTFSISERMLNLESHNRPIKQNHSPNIHYMLSQLLVTELGSEEAFDSRYFSCFYRIIRVVKVDIVPQTASKYFSLPEF